MVGSGQLINMSLFSFGAGNQHGYTLVFQHVPLTAFHINLYLHPSNQAKYPKLPQPVFPLTSPRRSRFDQACTKTHAQC